MASILDLRKNLVTSDRSPNDDTPSFSEGSAPVGAVSEETEADRIGGRSGVAGILRESSVAGWRKIILNPFQNSLQLRLIWTAPTASFARHRAYGHASSQELTPGTRPDKAHFTEGVLKWVR